MMNTEIFVLCFTVAYCSTDGDSYSNEWIAEVDVSEYHASKIFRRNGFEIINKIQDNMYILEHKPSPRSSRKRGDSVKKRISSEKHVIFAEQQKWNKRSLRSSSIDDQQWPYMWYLNGGVDPDLGVQNSWNESFTGEGIVVGVVDDGVEYTHPDLTSNFNRTLSYDFYDRDNEPFPDYVASNNHGTQCAGIALAAKNTECTIGVAFKGKLAVLRIFGAWGSTSTGERDALLQANIDIYSNSWGTLDKAGFEGPSSIVKSALMEGTQKGRNGLGAIYVWAAGNGGLDDNCNCDGFVNSIYTIAISGVSYSLQPPGYAEPCAAIMASTFSGGGGPSNNICTTSLNQTCVNSFTGTSAATPLAAGIFALVLEANKNLTWRDLQHLIVNTSDLSKLQYARSHVNGAGRTVSDFFGFGLLKADRLVKAAKQWIRVNDQRQCQTEKQIVKIQIPTHVSNRTVESSIFTNGCINTSREIEKLEHVQITIKYKFSFRGACQFYIVSPHGTRSQLLTRRSDDNVFNSTQEWTFMSVQFWDETPDGNWTLQMSLAMDFLETAVLEEWSMTMFGTTTRFVDEDNGGHTDGLTLIEKILIGIGVFVLAIVIIVVVLLKYQNNRCPGRNRVEGNI